MRHMIFAVAFLLEVVVFGADLRKATAVATVTAGYVTGITVTSGGSGYTSEPSNSTIVQLQNGSTQLGDPRKATAEQTMEVPDLGS